MRTSPLASWSRWVVFSGVLLAASVRADVLRDWTDVCTDAAVGAKQPAFAQTRSLAMVHVAMFDAIDAVEKRYAPYISVPGAPTDAKSSPEAAAATAAHDVLVAILPEQKATFDTALDRSLAAVSDAKARADGGALGRRIAAAVVALRASDGASAPNLYRPATSPGVYVPTAMPAGSSGGR